MSLWKSSWQRWRRSCNASMGRQVHEQLCEGNSQSFRWLAAVSRNGPTLLFWPRARDTNHQLQPADAQTYRPVRTQRRRQELHSTGGGDAPLAEAAGDGGTLFQRMA